MRGNYGEKRGNGTGENAMGERDTHVSKAYSSSAQHDRSQSFLRKVVTRCKESQLGKPHLTIFFKKERGQQVLKAHI